MCVRAACRGGGTREEVRSVMGGGHIVEVGGGSWLKLLGRNVVHIADADPGYNMFGQGRVCYRISIASQQNTDNHKSMKEL